MSFYYLLSRNFLNVLFRIFYGLKTEGIRQNDWGGGLIIATNHQCFMDPLFVGSVTPRELHYFAKEEIFTWPVLGFLARKFNAFPTTRDSFDLKAIRNANNILTNSKPLLVFIEGTRSRTGEMLSPQKGVGMMAWKNKVDVIPGYVFGSFYLRRAFLKYPGLLIRFGDRIYIKEYLALNLPRKEIYDLISEHVMNQIKKLRVEVLTYLDVIKKNASSEANK